MNFVVWRKIADYDNDYEVSTDGRVREVIGDNQCVALKLIKSISGHMFVELKKNNRVHTIPVDYLVASTFINNPTNKELIIHKDGNKQNNNIENLKWFDIEDVDVVKANNTIQCYTPTEEQKAISSLKNSGARNGNAKEVYQFNYLGEFIKKWDCIADAEKTLNIKGISRACRKPFARAGGYIWRYDKSTISVLNMF